MVIPLLRAQTGRVLVESHRGADKLAPENSWTAIELGYKAGADFIEMDVQMTADRELVIFHHYRAPDGQLIRAMRRNDETRHSASRVPATHSRHPRAKSSVA